MKPGNIIIMLLVSVPYALQKPEELVDHQYTTTVCIMMVYVIGFFAGKNNRD